MIQPADLERSRPGSATDGPTDYDPHYAAATKPLLAISIMNIVLSFDYELFFGASSGSPEKCMIEPAEEMAAIAEQYGAPLCVFVDTGYLDALKRFSHSNEELRRQALLLRHNLDRLAAQGHELLLHVHPHWEDAVWIDGRWDFDLSRFCLSDFSPEAVMDIVKRHADELRPHTLNGRIHAYRAGGWAVQPFTAIGNALKAVGIRIDSSVYPGGQDVTGKTKFDFSGAPRKAHWKFENDPAVENPQGTFLEIPISSMKVRPLDHWRSGNRTVDEISRHDAFWRRCSSINAICQEPAGQAHQALLYNALLRNSGWYESRSCNG